MLLMSGVRIEAHARNINEDQAPRVHITSAAYTHRQIVGLRRREGRGEEREKKGMQGVERAGEERGGEGR